MGQKKRLRSIEHQIGLASAEARNQCVEEIRKKQKMDSSSQLLHDYEKQELEQTGG